MKNFLGKILQAITSPYENEKKINQHLPRFLHMRLGRGPSKFHLIIIALGLTTLFIYWGIAYIKYH